MPLANSLAPWRRPPGMRHHYSRRQEDTAMKNQICLLLLAMSVSAQALAVPLPPDARTDAVDKIFASFTKPDSPGCAVGIYQNGQVSYKHAYGMADLERDVPLTPDSVFYVGSVAKQFTAASVVLLAEEGKLKFSDSVRKYVPELPAYFDQVTIDHLIHHTSGVRDVLELVPLIHDGLGQLHISDLEAEMRDGLGDFHISDEMFLQLMARQKALNFQPGERMAYSNSGYIMLSIVVKRASGKSLREFAKEQIFDPLGMKSTQYLDDHAEIVKHRAIGYYPRRSGGFFIDAATLDVVGDGGLFSTVEDLLRWNHNFDTGQVGGPEFLKTMLTIGKLNDGRTAGYASGLFLERYRSLNTVGHGGSLHAYQTDFLRFPDEQFAVVCLCNTQSNPAGLTRQIAQLYLGDKMKDNPPLTSRSSNARPTPTPTPDLKRADLNDYAGDYYSDELQVTYRFIVENDQLKLYGRKSNDPVAYPRGSDRFFYKRGMVLEFTRGAQKQITGFTLFMVGAEDVRPGQKGIDFTRVQH